MTLHNLTVGDKVKIVAYTKKQSDYRKKLLAMGLVPGTEFKIVRIAPLGDPIEISVRGFSLILRKNELQIIKLEKINSCEN